MAAVEIPVKDVTRQPDIDVDKIIDEIEDILPQPKKDPFKMPSGPLKVVHAFWLAGMSCDGCSISTVGATQPSVESLLTGSIPGLPKLILHHPVLSVEAGEEFVHSYELAERDELDAPFVIVFEGSVPDESIASANGGYWSGMGAREVDGEMQPIPTAEWLRRMAPNAAAVVAIGTCATWGGVPAAIGNPTNAMGVMDFLGEEYRSIFGLPVINIPGCAPVGDNFTETVAAVLLFLQGLGPLPEFDELGRPVWLYGETVHRGCTRAGFYEEGTFADTYGQKECLVEIGCWGPVVQCNINKRGAINHMGGCMNVGAPCIGCTMPAFPDGFSPFYQRPPGTLVSSSASRTHGFVIRMLRQNTQFHQNRTRRWAEQGHVPGGWGRVREPNAVERVAQYFYKKLQFRGGKKPGSLPHG